MTTLLIIQDLVSGDDANNLSGMLQNNLASYAQAAVNAGAASSASGLQKVFEIQRDWILNQNAGISESFDYSFGESDARCTLSTRLTDRRQHARLRLVVLAAILARLDQDSGQPAICQQLPN